MRSTNLASAGGVGGGGLGDGDFDGMGVGDGWGAEEDPSASVTVDVEVLEEGGDGGAGVGGGSGGDGDGGEGGSKPNVAAASCTLTGSLVTIAGARGAMVHGQLSVPAVKPWTAETPYLRTVLLTLKDSAGRVMEVTKHRVGFRTVEVTGGRLLVNGRAVTIRGVNRHEHDPTHGHVVSYKSMRDGGSRAPYSMPKLNNPNNNDDANSLPS